MNLPTPTRDVPLTVDTPNAERILDSLDVSQDNYNLLSAGTLTFSDGGPTGIGPSGEDVSEPSTSQATMGMEEPGSVSFSDSLAGFTALLEFHLESDLLEFLSPLADIYLDLPPPEESELMLTSHLPEPASGFSEADSSLALVAIQPSSELRVLLVDSEESLPPEDPTVPLAPLGSKEGETSVIVGTTPISPVSKGDHHLETELSLPIHDTKLSPRSDVPLFGEVVATAPLKEAVAVSSGECILPLEDLCQNSAPLSLDEGPSGAVVDFPDHGIEWPSGAQSAPICDEKTMFEAYIHGIRVIIHKESPPSIEAVREVLQKNTLICHLMGFVKEHWMDTVEEIWTEVRCLHETAAREAHQLKLGQLEAKLSTMNASRDELTCQLEALKARQITLKQYEVETKSEIQSLEEVVRSSMDKIKSLSITMASAVKELEHLETETATLVQKQLDFDDQIMAMTSQIEELQKS